MISTSSKLPSSIPQDNLSYAAASHQNNLHIKYLLTLKGVTLISKLINLFKLTKSIKNGKIWKNKWLDKCIVNIFFLTYSIQDIFT